MQILIQLIHAAHYAATLLVFGSLCFGYLIARPALHAIGGSAGEGKPILDFSLRAAWWGLGGVVVTGAFWLIGQAVSVSGLPIADAIDSSVIATVLTQTGFGRVWLVRSALLVVLAILLGVAGARRHLGPATALEGAALLVAGAVLGGLAFTGHAMSLAGWEGWTHLGADLVHLLAAGAWLGALPPLTHLLALRTAPARRPAGIAYAACRRFSTLGAISVAALIGTGLVNTWFLVGNIPALIGTSYGRLLMLKLALFAAMLGLAAVNRVKLTPRLDAGAVRGDDARAALRLLRRNAGLETGLGLLLLLTLGVISTSTPALHTQPVWPIPFDLSWDAMVQSGLVRWAVWIAVAAAIGGLGLVAYGARAQRTLAARAGVVVLALAIGAPLWLLAVPAYPTTYFHSPIRFDAVSIARGEPLYQQNCSACHGLYGYGDGPAAEQLAVKPADLTGQHLLHHGEGTLFWWITHGIEGTPMPGFGEALSESQRWDVLNFLHAQSDAEQGNVMAPDAEAWRPLTAPDFAFQMGDSNQETLKGQRGRSIVLIVLYSLPTSGPRLQQLAEARVSLEHAGVRVIAVPISAGDGEAGGAWAPLVAATGPEAALTYALYRRAPSVEGVPPVPQHLEFLVDRQGYLRFRWNPADGPGWDNLDQLLRRVELLNREPPRPPAPEGHVH